MDGKVKGILFMPINSTMVISILGSLGVASIAQVISHGLAQKREDNKYNKECLQNLYSPMIFRIRDYINGEAYRESVFTTDYYNTSEYLEDPQNPDILLKKIMEHLESNLKYSSAEMIMKYEEVRIMLELYNDEREDRAVLLKPTMDLCGEFLMEFIKISKELDILSNTIKKEITSALLFTQFYLLISDIGLYYIRMESPYLINFLNYRELSLSTQDNWAQKCINLRQKIKSTMKEIDNINDLDEELIGETLELLFDIINEFSKYSSNANDIAKSWLEVLNETQNLRAKILG